MSLVFLFRGLANAERERRPFCDLPVHLSERSRGFGFGILVGRRVDVVQRCLQQRGRCRERGVLVVRREKRARIRPVERATRRVGRDVEEVEAGLIVERIAGTSGEAELLRPLIRIDQRPLRAIAKRVCSWSFPASKWNCRAAVTDVNVTAPIRQSSTAERPELSVSTGFAMSRSISSHEPMIGA